MALPPLLTDVTKVVRATPTKLPYGLAVEDWLLTGPNDFAKMGKLKPKTPEDLRTRGDADWFYKHYFTDEDSWTSLANVAGYPEPEILIRMNFGIGIDVIGRPNGEAMNFPQINWFMEKFCNCNRTRDKLNFSFSASAHNNTKSGKGFIWMPKKKATPWPPPLKIKDIENPEPVLVDADILQSFGKSATRFPLQRASEFGHVGEEWDSIRDRRLVLYIDGIDTWCHVYFMVTKVKEAHHAKTIGKVYRQTCAGMASDLHHAAIAEVGRRGRPFQKYAMLEVRFMMGVAEGAQGLIGGIIVFGGMAAVEFILDNSDKFDNYARIAGALGVLTSAMKTHTPNFYTKTRNALLWETLLNIPSAIWNDPNVMARVAGNWVGGIGRTAFLGALSSFSVLLGVLGPVATKGGAASGGKVGVEYADAAKKIGHAVAELKGDVSDGELNTGYAIIAEVTAQYIHLKQPMEKLLTLLAKGLN